MNDIVTIIVSITYKHFATVSLNFLLFVLLTKSTLAGGFL